MGVAEDIELFERSLKELTIKYEQYFLGLEKREPVKLLEEVDRLSRRYTAAAINNSMLLFKYNSLKSRLVSYRNLWNRTIRLMEEGKYSRDRSRLERRQEPAHQPSPQERGGDGEADQVFRQYLDACRACNLPTDNLTRERIADTIAKSRSAIKEQYQCSDLEFRVVVEDGKPKIKARPKA